MRIETAYGATALDALARVVGELKSGDPMAPVSIVVPNNLAGIVARRRLAGGLPGGRPGIAALEITTLRRLAEGLAVSHLAGRRPATRPLLAATYRAALIEDAGVFAPVADHTATLQALARTH